MKKQGTTIVFVLVCVIVLVASYGIGLCIREVRFSGVKKASAAVAKSEKPAGGPGSEQAQTGQTPGGGASEAAGNLTPDQGAALTDQRGGTRPRFENMTDAEREAFRNQMRDRFGGGRRGGMGSQLSEEDRAKMREELDSLRAKWDQMSDEEKEKARNEFSEKYGFAPRIGSGRGFGGGEGGRQRSSTGPGDGQSDNN
jgi:hypothetical protein